MRFQTEHRFAAPVGAVIALLVDPAFHRALRLPDLSLLEAGSHTQGGRTVLRLRYDFVGHLDPVAKRMLGHRRLTWLQELRLDRTTGAGRLSFEAEADPRRLHGAAEVTLGSRDGGTVRRLDGELVAAVPLMGRTAARRITPGILRRLDIEARAVDEHLRVG